jgi:hypothetical protein
VQALFVLLGFAIVAGIGALLLRSFMLTVAFAVALALVAMQWPSDHEHARATVAVGVHARDAETTKVDVDDVDATFLSRLADATVSGSSRRIDVAAKASSVAGAISSVRAAAGRIESAVIARVPSSADADARVSKAEAALTQATAARDAAEAAVSEWRAAKGSGNPTALREQAEAVLNALEKQQRSSDPATARAAALAIPAAQQQVFDYSSAELQLGELTTAQNTGRREVADATKALNQARVAVAVAGSREGLVQTGPIRVKSVDNGPGLRAALLFALILCVLAFALTRYFRRRAARVAFQFAGAGAATPDVTNAPAPRAKLHLEPEPEPRPEPLLEFPAEPVPEPEPEPVVVEAPPPPLVLRSEPVGDLEPMVFTPEPRFVPRPFTRPLEPQPEPVTQPVATPEPPTPQPATPSEPEAEPFTVLVYRAPGAKAGKEPAPTFEVRELAPAPSAADVDLAGAERAEGAAPETIDLTDAVSDRAEEDESNRRPEQ